jgi:nitroimidazol reductase NimA-like FMN-containing flavoprotein (pyridoxamine 5'-phosphate oxidase superfamily)
MLEKMKDVIRSQDMCVLATVSGSKPHCSLMAYVTDDDCRNIYMITLKHTTKYQNLTANPSACLLIDTRLSDRSEQRREAKALTVNGAFERIKDPNKLLSMQAKFSQRHVHLKEFASQPDAEVFAVKIHSLQLLKGATDAYFETLE